MTVASINDKHSQRLHKNVFDKRLFFQYLGIYEINQISVCLIMTTNINRDRQENKLGITECQI